MESESAGVRVERSVPDQVETAEPRRIGAEVLDRSRIQSLDVLRGFALVGILLANIPALAHAVIPDSQTTDDRLRQVIDYGFEQRFFPIFSFLFGVGFFIFLRNATRRGQPARWLFTRRIVVLIVLGIGHQLLQPGEALLIYGVVGLGLIPFANASVRVLVAGTLVVLALALVSTEYLVVPAMFLLGAAAGRVGYFEDPTRQRRLARAALAASVLLSPVLMWAQYRSVQPDSPWIDYASNVQTAAGLVIAAGLVGAVSLALQHPAGNRLLAPLAPFGRMALTNYIAQTLIVLGVTALLGLRDVMTYREVFLLWLAICVVQIPASRLWLDGFRYGPLEWVWRWLTYGRRPAFRRGDSAGAA